MRTLYLSCLVWMVLGLGKVWAAHVDRWVIDDLTYDMTPTPERPVVHGRQISNGGYTSWEYPVVQPVPYLRFGNRLDIGSGAHTEILALPDDDGSRLTMSGQYYAPWPNMTSSDESAVSVVTVSRQLPDADTHQVFVGDYDYLDVTIAREVTSGIPLTIRPQFWFGQYPRSAPREAAINMVSTTEPTTYRLSLNNEVWGPWRDSYITRVGWVVENLSKVNGWDTFNFDDVTLVVGDGTWVDNFASYTSPENPIVDISDDGGVGSWWPTIRPAPYKIRGEFVGDITVGPKNYWPFNDPASNAASVLAYWDISCEDDCPESHSTTVSKKVGNLAPTSLTVDLFWDQPSLGTAASISAFATDGTSVFHGDRVSIDNDVSLTSPTRYELALDHDLTGEGEIGFTIWLDDWPVEFEGDFVRGSFVIDNLSVGSSAISEPRMDGDANMDGVVDLGDLGVFLRNLGNTNADWHDADFDGSRIVDLGDLGIFLRNLGRTSPGLSSPVMNPEPSTLGLLIVGGMLLGVRR